jgi:site-specific recombinase XerD
MERSLTMTELRRRMIADMQLRGLAPGTQQTYLEAIKNLARHYHRPPDQLNESEIREFFVDLTQRRCLAANTVRVSLFAIKFLYQKTLQRPWPVLNLIRIRRSKKLPVVLSREEVRQLLWEVRWPAARMSLTLMYACGLRASEATHLQASDIDSQRMVVRVRRGKGDKDREVPLPRPVLEQLRAYWRQYRPAPWLFPSQTGLTPIPIGSARRCLKAALRRSGIKKEISCHSLRHAYATHLLEQGLNLRIIQGLLGHRSLKTTFIYLHLTQSTLQTVHRTVDHLMAGL